MSSYVRWALVGVVMLGIGCSGESSKKTTSGHAGANARAAAVPAEPSKASIEYRTLGERIAPNGHVVDVKMYEGGKGPRFEPSTVSAHRGDVVEFKIMSGVHNVHFPAERNPGVHVPPASEELKLSGQAYDLVVGAKPGTYYFQSDPDARGGMVGKLIVQ